MFETVHDLSKLQLAAVRCFPTVPNLKNALLKETYKDHLCILTNGDRVWSSCQTFYHQKKLPPSFETRLESLKKMHSLKMNIWINAFVKRQISPFVGLSASVNKTTGHCFLFRWQKIAARYLH